MKTNRPRHANRTGGILPLVMMILVAFTLLVVALLQLGRNSAQEAEYQLNEAQAFSLAEAGLEQFKAIVNSNRFPIALAAAARNWSNNVPNAGSYSVVVTDDPAWNNVSQFIKKYIITSTGRARNGAVQTLSTKAAIKTFGDYLWATLSENGVWFTTGDFVRGPVRTDDQLRINGTPRFFALVESAANSVRYQSGGSLAVFEGGLQLGVPVLDWTGVQQQVNDLSIDPMTQTLNGSYDITFADTKAILQSVTVAGDGTRTPNGSAVTNAITPGRIYYVTGNAYVKQGTVGTRVSVVTPGSIFIEGDITYQSVADNSKPADPSQWGVWKPDPAEALGLYSQTLVEIDYPSPINQPVNIHAAILVPNGSFRANEDDRTSNIGRPYINFYGSLGQETRGAVGTTAGAGYLKNYNYDSRFVEQPPPGIPYSAFYFSEWKQL